MTSRLARSPVLWAWPLLLGCSQGPTPRSGAGAGSPTTPASPSEAVPPGAGALIPSRESERALALFRAERELEKTLATVDGVRTARVHVAVPDADPFAEERPAPGTASVLLRTAPGCQLVDAQVRALVAGAVEGLSPSAVAVVRVPVEPAEAPVELVRVGPFTATAASASGLRAMLAALAVLNIAWVTLVLRAWLRHRQPRASRRVAPEAR